MVHPTWRDLHHQHPRRANVCRSRYVLDELRDERFSRDRVAEEDSVGEMRPWPV